MFKDRWRDEKRLGYIRKKNSTSAKKGSDLLGGKFIAKASGAPKGGEGEGVKRRPGGWNWRIGFAPKKCPRRALLFPRHLLDIEGENERIASTGRG